MYTSFTMMTTSKTTRLQDYTNHKGLALCGHTTLDVTARWWVPINTHGTPEPQRREAVNESVVDGKSSALCREKLEPMNFKKIKDYRQFFTIT